MMNYATEPTCAKEFLDRTIEEYPLYPNEALFKARRFASEHDTVELSTQQKVIIRCRLGGCSVTLAMTDGELTARAARCSRHPQPLTK